MGRFVFSPYTCPAPLLKKLSRKIYNFRRMTLYPSNTQTIGDPYESPNFSLLTFFLTLSLHQATKKRRGQGLGGVLFDDLSCCGAKIKRTMMRASPTSPGQGKT